MEALPASLQHHRMHTDDPADVVRGRVRYAPVKSLWLAGMAGAALAGALLAFTWTGLLLFLALTGTVLLLGHSLGSHRKLIHDSFACPRWLEYLLVWLGVQVGLAGPLGLLRQHELRDYAQRLPDCHPYLRHGSGFWKDAWWQLHCELVLDAPPALTIEPRIAQDRFYRWLERTWMLQQLPPALLLFAWGGWAFVAWGACARITAGVIGHWLIGWFAHNRGPMHHTVDGAAVQGHNVRWTSLLTMGECWHNNHHAFPGSARLGIGPGEWDPGWWVLVALQKLGLVRSLRLPQDLAARPELRALDPLAAATAAPGPRPHWRRLWALSAARTESLLLCGPAATASPALLRQLAGAGATFVHEPATQRLTTRIGGVEVRGWTALWLALARRSPLHRNFAAVLLPLACATEAVRDFCCEPA
jgi:stearoyl-CoA desaturase (delta-9 desaturase)